ncbi:MAG: phytoene/squalene synthase family protein [Armatimonadetes bacterium]|nr:phytoene/squalene synthase family protein [Armatimonadota bacterium]
MRVAAPEPQAMEELEEAFASSADYAVCKRIHRRFGTTYYFATSRFKPEMRRRTHAIYAFVRVPDEWVDNPDGLSLEESRSYLEGWRSQLRRGLDGVRPDHPVMRAFCDVMKEVHIPLDEPMRFLDAMEQDLHVDRYPTFGDLRDYMRGSASAVGLMMCCAMGAPSNSQAHRSAQALGEAMQLTNFLRDIGEDLDRNRIYVPLEDLQSFGVSEEDFRNRKITPAFKSLMQFEIARARALYAEADRGIRLLPAEAQRPVKLARILYARILNKIEERDYDVFSTRARTSKMEKLMVAAQVLLSRSA